MPPENTPENTPPIDRTNYCTGCHVNSTAPEDHTCGTQSHFEERRCGFGDAEQCTNVGKHRRWNGVSLYLWACDEHAGRESSLPYRARVIHEIEAGDSPHSVVVFGHHLPIDDFWRAFHVAAYEYGVSRTWSLYPAEDPPEVQFEQWSRFTDPDEGEDDSRVQLPVAGELPDDICVWWWDTAYPQNGDDMQQSIPVTFTNVLCRSTRIEIGGFR